MSNKQLRNWLRISHLILGALIGVYLYSPLGDNEAFATLVRISIPFLTLTGIAMWQQPALSKMLRGGRRATHEES